LRDFSRPGFFTATMDGMKYKNFLFDWDGSLADTLPDWFRAYKKILFQNGVEATDDTVRQVTFGRTDVRELGITDAEKFFDEVEQEIRPSLDGAMLNEGALKMLMRIKNIGGKVGVVTDSKKKWVKIALRNNGLRELVDVFLAREDVERRKPDPEVIWKALKYMGGNVSDTLVTGDNWRDVEAAKAAGVDSCLYFPKRYEQFYGREMQKRLGATMMIEDFGEMERLI
jgi:HAD superfamily hydrolase (TIGR01509 family)